MAAAGSGLHDRNIALLAFVVGAGAVVVVVTTGAVGVTFGVRRADFDPGPGPLVGRVVVVGAGTVVVVTTGAVGAGFGAPGVGLDPYPGRLAGWVVAVGTGTVGAVTTGTVGVGMDGGVGIDGTDAAFDT